MSETPLSSVDEAAQAIARQRHAETVTKTEQEKSDDDIQAVAPEEDIETAKGAGAEPDADGIVPSDPASGDHDDAHAPEAIPVSDAPASWPKDRLEEWRELSDSAREVFLARESDIHAALSDKGREAAEARRLAEAEQTRVATEYQDRINTLNQLLPELAASYRSKYGAIDWVKLADESPDQYTRLRAKADQERQVIDAARMQAQQVQTQVEQAHVNNEVGALFARNPDYTTEKGRKRLTEEAREVEAFALTLDGVTREQLNQISAPIYETLRDAMRYRKASLTAANAAKQPAQRFSKPGARRSSSETAKKKLSEAKANLKALAKAGAGRTAQDSAMADALAAKRRTR